MPGFFLTSTEITRIKKTEKKEVYWLQEGVRQSGGTPYYYWSRRSWPMKPLKPGDTVKVDKPVTLNQYYDLSLPGEYELTFYTRNFLGTDEEQIGEYPKPCTVRFKIEGTENWLDKHVHWEESEVNSPKEFQELE